MVILNSPSCSDNRVFIRCQVTKVYVLPIENSEFNSMHLKILLVQLLCPIKVGLIGLKVKVEGCFMPHSTARVKLGQVLSNATCGR